jgi:hypothetical protein
LFRQLAEQLVVERRVDHHRREQVERERERVGAEAEAVRTDAAVAQRVRHRPGERPSVVVDGGALAAVVLVGAEQFLGELAEHAAPQVEVIRLVPRGVAGRLEDPDGDHLVHAAGVADPRRVPPVQRERRGARRAVMAEGQRAGGDDRRARGRVPRVPDGVAQRRTATWLEFGGGELVRGGAADVDAVEEPAAGEGQVRAFTGQVRVKQPVGAAVLEDGGAGEL